MKRALYPGSFDPVTTGHLDVIGRAARLFDELVVAVGTNTTKDPVFGVDERLRHLEIACRDFSTVRVASFDGLLTAAVHDFRAVAVVRGLRAVSDFEIEFQMALMNRTRCPECETVFLMPSPEYSYVSSTMIREIARLGGSIEPFVPTEIANELSRRLRES